MGDNPVTKYYTGKFPDQHQAQPGLTGETRPWPDHGEESYVGSGRLAGKRALITGGADGCGGDGRVDRSAGRAALLLPGDARDEDYCVGLAARGSERVPKLLPAAPG